MKKFLTLLLALLCTFFAACSNSVDDMVDEYNGNFEDETKNYKAYGLSPGDIGFSEEYMLYSKYSVRSDGTLILCAPKNCASYKWELYKLTEKSTTYLTSVGEYVVKKTEEEQVELILSNGTTSTTKLFNLYVPESKLEIGSYKLKLTVTDEEKNEYKDSCSLVIYLGA